MILCQLPFYLELQLGHGVISRKVAIQPPQKYCH